jgi:RecB family exonuclease
MTSQPQNQQVYLPLGTPLLERLQAHLTQGCLDERPWQTVVLPTQSMVMHLQHHLSFLPMFMEHAAPKVLLLEDWIRQSGIFPSQQHLPLHRALRGVLEFLHVRHRQESFPVLLSMASSLLALWDGYETHWRHLKDTPHWHENHGLLLAFEVYWNAFLEKHHAKSLMQEVEEKLLLPVPDASLFPSIILVGSEAPSPLFLRVAEWIGRLPRGMVVLPSPTHEVIKQESSLSSLQYFGLSHARNCTKIDCFSVQEQAQVAAEWIWNRSQYLPNMLPIVVCSSPLLVRAIHEALLSLGAEIEQNTDEVELSFLIALLQVALDGFSKAGLLALGRHPLILRQVPGALRKMVFFEQGYETWERVVWEHIPKWILRHFPRIKMVFSSLQAYIQTAHSLEDWILFHRSMAQQLIPTWKESPLLEGLDPWRWALACEPMPLKAEAYFSFLLDILRSTQKKLWPLAILCTIEEAQLLGGSCLLVGDSEEAFFHDASSALFPSFAPSLGQALGMPKSFKTELFARDITFIARVPPLGFSKAYLPSEVPLIFPPLNQLSVHNLQLWQRDPKTFHAHCVLKILSNTQSPPYVWGKTWHTIMDQWIRQCPPLVKEVQPLLLTLQALAKAHLPSEPILTPIQDVLLQELLMSIATLEAKRRQDLRYRSFPGLCGTLRFEFPEGIFTLTGKIDRLDVWEDGTFHIIDYTTGKCPSMADLETLRWISLPLLAMMAEKGSFGPDLKHCSNLSYWSLSLYHGCDLKTYTKDIPALIATLSETLPKLLKGFLQGKPYGLKHGDNKEDDDVG